MTLLNKLIHGFAFLSALVLLTTFSDAQDIYDIDHSKKFASYLFRTKQYDLAINEYERIIYMSPADTNARLMLIRSYRLGNKYTAGINRIHNLYNNSMPFTENISLEYARLLILNNNYDTAYGFLDKNTTIDHSTRSAYMIGILLLKKDWTEANNSLMFRSASEHSGNRLYEKLAYIIEESSGLKYKKPVIAMGLSAIIPGTGKFYSKNRADGLISFLFIAANAWNSYRGFRKYGTESAYGWIFGSITFCFYTGNIYGSYKAAKKYNKELDEEIYNKAKDTLYNNF